ERVGHLAQKLGRRQNIDPRIRGRRGDVAQTKHRQNRHDGQDDEQRPKNQPNLVFYGQAGNDIAHAAFLEVTAVTGIWRKPRLWIQSKWVTVRLPYTASRSSP